MLLFFKAPFLFAHFLPCIDSLPDVICNTAIYTGDIYAACSKCEHASDLWQKLEFTCELEPDSRETADWGRKWLFNFSAKKTQLVSVDRPNNSNVINVKMDGSVLEEKSFFRILGLSFSPKLDWGSYIVV